MSKIQKSNFFDVSHNIVEQRIGEEYFYPLRYFKNSTLKLYIALCHYANRFSSNRFYMDDTRLNIKTGISVRQLCRARSDLRRLKLIKTHKRVGFAIDYEIAIMPSIAEHIAKKGITDVTRLAESVCQQWRTY